MKKIYTFLVLALLMPLQACAVEQWKEGEHFIVLDKPATEKPEIREYFSFWCPACNAFEPLVAQMKAKMPEGTSFNKIHVNFMRFASSDTQDAATRAMMIGRASNQEDKFNAAIFNYIHKQRAPITSLDDLRNIFIVNGMDGEEFDKLAKSFGVNSLLNKNNKQVADYRQYVSGVPNFIVNGKYQATFKRGMSADEMVDLVLWLLNQP